MLRKKKVLVLKRLFDIGENIICIEFMIVDFNIFNFVRIIYFIIDMY